MFFDHAFDRAFVVPLLCLCCAFLIVLTVAHYLALSHHPCKHSKDTEFCMEVVPKTRADTVGGTLVEYKGQTRLLEVGEVPKKHRQSFLSTSSNFNLFNTNNLWVNLRAIQRLCASGAMNGDVIVKQTSVDDPNNTNHVRTMLHLATAAGAAVKFFTGSALGLQVPRSRFRPVKTTSDLLAVQSTLYSMKHGALVMNPMRSINSAPLIKLGPEFTNVDEYMERFSGGVPDIVGLDHLTVSGNVYFGPGVVLKGTVIIVCNEGSRIDIPPHSVLENVVVTGSLRVVAH